MRTVGKDCGTSERAGARYLLASAGDKLDAPERSEEIEF